MTLSDLSIKRPVFAWMLMVGLITFGAIAFNRMGVSQLPSVDFPVINVSVTLEGAAPEVMELDVVDVLESAVMGIEGVRSVSSSARNGSARVTVEFDLDRNIDVALQEVQTKIAQAQRQLPDQIDPPVITKTNPEDQPIIWLGVSSKNWDAPKLMAFVRDFLKDKFSTINGVGEVFLGGYIDPNLRVWVDPEKLSRYYLSVNDVIASIQSEHAEVPGGQIETPEKQFNVRTMGEATSPAEFGKIVISSRGGAPNYLPIRLDQVAKIEEGLAQVQRISRVNGNPAVGIGIRKQRGSNDVQVAQDVKAKMEELRKSLPEGVDIGVNFDSTKFIEESVHELNFTLVLSALLTALVCWMFLGSWTATFNVLMAIPTSIVGSFIVLYAFKFTLNTFTLLGLSLAIGIVVDDAIMVLENIFRHKEEGKSRIEAAIIGAREITFAALAATVAIVAIFLPVAFMKGIIGKFFFQFGVTMTVAVLLSLLEALTLTPMRCARFVHAGARSTRLGKAVDAAIALTARFYTRVLSVWLYHPWKVILGSLLVFAGSIAAVKFLNKEFSPAQDQSRFMVRIQTPVGSSLPYTDAKARQVEAFLARQPVVERYFGAIGGFGGGETNTAIFFVTMKPKGVRGANQAARREWTQGDFMAVVRQELTKIQDLKVVIQDMSMRGFTASRGFPIEFTVRGPDWDELARHSQALTDAMKKTGLMTDIDTDYLLGMPEVQVRPNREAAALRGVNVAAIGQTVSALIGGVPVGKYPKDGHRNDIRVQLPQKESRVDEIGKLTVRNNRGQLIPLQEVVTIQTKPSLQQISRYGRERAVSVFANVAPGASQARALAEVQAIGKRLLPEGYRIETSGSAETFKESFESLIFALVLGLLVSYMVLASQFNSYIDPITVLVALPFSISGAFLGLLVMGQSLNIFSMIGIILLMGIVKKNSILLVDFTNQVRASGVKDVKEALLRACPMRLRPILMTSIATIAGAIPPALSLGPGAETRIPMAVAVVGGVLVSTVLTLFVVPCVYERFSKLERRGQEEEETRQAFKNVDSLTN